LAPLEGDPDPNGDDCVACGRCCHHPPKTVSLLEADEERMGTLLPIYTEVESKPPYFRFIKNLGSHCGALDVSKPGLYPCAIYTVRPEGCRTVEPGSPCCLEARRLGHLGSSVEFKRVV
jgi:Fe-S-cluster containining protein